MSDFVKQVKVLFNEVVHETNDRLTVAKIASRKNIENVQAYRSGDVIWRPVQYITRVMNGVDITAANRNVTQLMTAYRLGKQKVVAVDFSSNDLRDKENYRRVMDSMLRAMDSQINQDLLEDVSLRGAQVVSRTASLSGFDDVAACDAVLNECGIGSLNDPRTLVLSTRSYNGMASNLALRQTMTGSPERAYRDGYLGEVCGFETYKLDYNKRIRAGGSPTITMNTTPAGNNYWVPVGTYVDGFGNQANYDFRYQTVTFSSTANLQAGDALQIGGIFSVHLQSKNVSSQLKTVRVVSVINGTQAIISPALVTGQGGTPQESQYQNAAVVTASATAGVTVLNKNAADINPFFIKGGLEFIPGIPTDPTMKDGVIIEAVTNELGITFVLQAQKSILTGNHTLRVDMLYGTNVMPEQCGILIGGQA